MDMLRKSVSGSRLALLTLLLLTLVSTFMLLTPKPAEAILCGSGSYPGSGTTCYDANHQPICSATCGDTCDCTGAVYYRQFQTCCYL
jgi:hypothetical protein